MFSRLETTESVRVHGLQLPWNSLQISAWILYTALIVYYFALMFPLLWRQISATVLITAVFCLSAVASAVFGAVTAYVNPVDEAVLRLPVDPVDRVLCYLCDVRV